MPSLTKKEGQVLEAMAKGYYLRRKEFSWFYEIAGRSRDNITTPQSKSSALFNVNQNVVDNLRSKGLIYIGTPEGEGRSRCLISDAGRALLDKVNKQ